MQVGKYHDFSLDKQRLIETVFKTKRSFTSQFGLSHCLSTANNYAPSEEKTPLIIIP